MTFRDMLRTALNNLGRRKVRTALTSVGVIVGILTIVTMVSLGVGVQLEIERQFAQLGLENVFVRPRAAEDNDFFTQFSVPERQTPITPDVVERWRQLPNVVSVTPRISLDGVTTLLEFPDDISEGNPQQRQINVIAPATIPNPFERPAQALAGTLDLVEPAGTLVLSKGVLPMDIAAEELIGTQVYIVLQSPRGESERFPLTVVGVSNSDTDEVQVAIDDTAAMKSWWFNMPDSSSYRGMTRQLSKEQMWAKRQISFARSVRMVFGCSHWN